MVRACSRTGATATFLRSRSSRMAGAMTRIGSTARTQKTARGLKLSYAPIAMHTLTMSQ